MAIAGYRRDIDGLRSIAIGSVVLYHAGFQVFSGGFVGVDIFFVISGFLITSGLLKDAAGDGISIARFYVRRIRRIVPAYLAVVLAALVVGAFLLLPSEYLALGRSALATSLFVANIHSWSETGYFSGSAISHPLLHMWSLAVEEQYYLIWPIVMMGFFGLQRRTGLSTAWLPRLIVVAIVLSLAASELMLSYSAKTVFYMAPFRAWELLLGSLLASVRWPRLPGPWAAHAIGGLALALMIVPILLLTEASRFPGLSALAPCLGAALILYRDERYPSFAAMLLSRRIPVFLGLISYSLYLWHWPVLSFFWYASRSDPSPGWAFALVLLMLALATLSWRYIERPFRVSAVPRAAGSDRNVLLLGAGGLAAAAIAAVVVLAGQGFPARLPPAAARVDALAREPYVSRHGCVLTDDLPDDPARSCFAAADRLPGRKIVLWGDSFAGQHVNTIERALDRPGRPVISVVATGCTPLAGVDQYFGKGRLDARCGQFNRAVFQELLRRPDIDSVIIAGRWSNLYGLPARMGTFDPTARFLMDADHRARNVRSSLDVMARSLDRMAGQLLDRGVAVTMLREPPRYAANVRDCVALALWRGQSVVSTCGMPEAEARAMREPVDAVFSRLHQRYNNLLIYDQITQLCPADYCLGYKNETLITRDTEHLTRAGSAIALGPLLKSARFSNFPAE
ncbi:acyltransferase family protein [Novosphingobium colocasiae]|uniref:acyltransferase family protein n=1 Tax=Novosphingobium colocasiae TaxID=1256513 RepID=UPI0035AE7AC6